MATCLLMTMIHTCTVCNSGGEFSEYKDKTRKSLTTGELEKHLKGEQFIGIYPLLKDNSTWFLVADFDKVNWEIECHKFLKACHERDIPVENYIFS
jgi:hypothetical protein